MALTLNQKNLSATETILEQLRNDINNFVYDEHFITEAEVSARFQVSRTPAREALNTLCQEGITVFYDILCYDRYLFITGEIQCSI